MFVYINNNLWVENPASCSLQVKFRLHDVIFKEYTSHSSNVFLICSSFLLRHPRTESPPTHAQTNSHALGKTHLWVSARHGDLSEWGPYSGLELNIS